MASIDDAVIQLRGIVSQLSAWVTAFNGRTLTGTFTLGAAATTVVPQTATTATSVIVPTPMNASAGALQGSAKALYISARSPGVSFTVATSSGAAAAGTEQFAYTIQTPQ